MSLHIEFDGIRDSETQVRIESAIRQCICGPPDDKEWDVKVTSYGCHPQKMRKNAIPAEESDRLSFIYRCLRESGRGRWIPTSGRGGPGTNMSQPALLRAHVSRYRRKEPVGQPA